MNKPESAEQLARQISTGIVALGQQPGQHPIDRYVCFLQLLSRWNKVYNLTAIRTADAMVTQHVLDSLAVLPYLRGNHGLDVGTGAGLPGLILAMARPDMRWVLLDSRQKKIRFITQAIIELHITDVATARARVEDYRPGALCTTVISRAFGSLRKFYASSRHLVAPAGILLAMKGGDMAGEIRELNETQDAPGYIQIHKLAVPGINKERCLVEMGAKKRVGSN